MMRSIELIGTAVAPRKVADLLAAADGIGKQPWPRERIGTMTSSNPRNEELFDRARQLMPGGVNSPVRAFGSVGGTPRFMVSAKGPYLTDADGNEYVDLVCSWGPALLGHAHPAVLEAVHAAVDRGLSFGASTPDEANLAAIVQERVPAAERVRMVSTGTEATMTAVRLARGFTGRNLIIKFAGCYHGHLDGLLAAAGSGRRHPGPARLGRRHRSHRRRNPGPALQRPRRRRSCVRRPRAQHRRRHHRGRARQHGRGHAWGGLQPRACPASPGSTAPC